MRSTPMLDNLKFIFILISILAIYISISYYISLRIWQSLKNFIPKLSKIIFFIPFTFIVAAYIIGRAGNAYLPPFTTKALSIIGSYWMAFFVYFLIIFPIIDIIRFIEKKAHFLPIKLKENKMLSNLEKLSGIILVTVIIVFGVINARIPRITHYDINISKSAGDLKKLHAVMVSDIHLGTIIDNYRLNKLVETVNSLHPDVILLAGDMIDENIAPFVDQKMSDTFLKLSPKLGTYAVLGNHEYFGRDINDVISELERSGVKLLRDETIKVNNSFYIVGRDDISSKNFNGAYRKNLSELLAQTDNSLPIIALDHQPKNLDEAEKAGVDLQLSGHTHAGQIFPGRFITKQIFEVDWGYLRKGNFQEIVSSGFGTWGPPVRTGTISEIVDIDIYFK